MLEKGNLENSYCKLENHAKGFARQRRSTIIKMILIHNKLKQKTAIGIQLENFYSFFKLFQSVLQKDYFVVSPRNDVNCIQLNFRIYHSCIRGKKLKADS